MKNGEFRNGVKQAGVPFFFLSSFIQINQASAKLGNPEPLRTCGKKKKKKSQKGKFKNIHFQAYIRENPPPWERGSLCGNIERYISYHMDAHAPCCLNPYE